jgi:hypothetical protein
MPFNLRWTDEAHSAYQALKTDAQAVSQATKSAKPRKKSGKNAGLFKQVHKCIQYLRDNPRHPGLHTHKYDSLEHPYERDQPIFEAYAQNKTPGAYRVFWCYGPQKGEITIVAITSHP